MAAEYTLRNYQQLAVDGVFNRWDTGHRFALVEMCVGAGKSLVMVDIIRRYKRAVLLSPCLELTTQNYARIEPIMPETTLIDSNHKGDWQTPILYTTPQTLSKNLDKLPEPEVVLIDEAALFHGGKMFTEIFDRWQTCKVAGFTGTPYVNRTSSSVLPDDYGEPSLYTTNKVVSIAEELYGRPVICLDRETLRNQYGFGCDIVFHQLDWREFPLIKSQKIKETNLMYDGAEKLTKQTADEQRLAKNIDSVARLVAYLKNSIIYCDEKFYASRLAEALNAPVVFGDSKPKERVALIEQFKNGEVKHVVTCGCLKLGFDFPELENVVILCNISSWMDAEQVVGRLNRGTAQKHVWYNGKLNMDRPVHGQSATYKISTMKDIWKKKKQKAYWAKENTRREKLAAEVASDFVPF